MGRIVFVGGLPEDIREKEIEDIFYKYGRVVDVDLKVPPRPPAFAFVEFEDSRDAEDACRGRDGYDFDGYKLRVELAHGGARRSRREDDGRDRGRGRQEGSISRRTDYRVVVTGLPTSASWQDLKDHIRKAGDVCFTQVYRDGRGGTSGVVDFNSYDDMRYAVRNLDDTEFRNPFSRAYIRVKEDRDGDREDDRDRSRSRDRDRDRDDRDRDDDRRDDRRNRDDDDRDDRDDRRDRRDRRRDDDDDDDDDDRRDNDILDKRDRRGDDDDEGREDDRRGRRDDDRDDDDDDRRDRKEEEDDRAGDRDIDGEKIETDRDGPKEDLDTQDDEQADA